MFLAQLEARAGNPIIEAEEEDQLQFFAQAKAYGQAVLRRQKAKGTILIDFGKYQTEGLTYLGAWEVGGIEYVEALESKI